MLKVQGEIGTAAGTPTEIDQGYAAERFRFVFPSTGPVRMESSPPIPILAVTSAVDLATFRFSSARSLPLTTSGNPFQGLNLLVPDFGADPVARRPSVEFSRDGMWALLHRQERRGKEKSSIDYIVSLRTGIVRRLPGTAAAFL